MSQPLMYLSFADDDGFNGACLVPGRDVIEARLNAGLMGCRPAKGGQVVGLPVVDGVDLPMAIGRLYSEAELRALTPCVTEGEAAQGLGTAMERGRDIQELQGG